MKKTGYLVLANGSAVKGELIYAKNEIVTGELVFSTVQGGYTEILTDPSFYGQILVLANPEIGNYGVNTEDFQSEKITVRALVIRNLSITASSYRSHMTLCDWLMREGIPVLHGVDSRFLIEEIREKGAQMAALGARDPHELLAVAHSTAKMDGQRLSQEVAVTKRSSFLPTTPTLKAHERLRIVIIDFGIKREIIRSFLRLNCEVILVPSTSSVEEIWVEKADGIFLSNGPGDPKTETKAVKTVKALLGKIPIFGVCMGHQVLAQALGLNTYKLPFGHRGSNQAVKKSDHSVVMTAQNHGFAVDSSKLNSNTLTEYNLADGSNEAINIPELMASSVQYHPEGSPGPKDQSYLFADFVQRLIEWRTEHLQKT